MIFIIKITLSIVIFKKRTNFYLFIANYIEDLEKCQAEPLLE